MLQGCGHFSSAVFTIIAPFWIIASLKVAIMLPNYSSYSTIKRRKDGEETTRVSLLRGPSFIRTFIGKSGFKKRNKRRNKHMLSVQQQINITGFKLYFYQYRSCSGWGLSLFLLDLFENDSTERWKIKWEKVFLTVRAPRGSALGSLTTTQGSSCLSFQCSWRSLHLKGPGGREVKKYTLTSERKISAFSVRWDESRSHAIGVFFASSSTDTQLWRDRNNDSLVTSSKDKMAEQRVHKCLLVSCVAAQRGRV